MYAVAMMQLKIIVGKDTFMKPTKVIGWLWWFAMACVTMLADAPIKDPLPPRHAPKHRAHANVGKGSPRPLSASAIWRSTGTCEIKIKKWHHHTGTVSKVKHREV